MSPILVNAGTSNLVNTGSITPCDHSEIKNEEDIEDAREERKATGRSIAIIVFISLMCLALYHVIERKKTILAGVSNNLIWNVS